MDVDAEIGALVASERDALLEWLDRGLRRGVRGRLEAEYPISLGSSTSEAHRIARIDGRLASHAMVHEVEAIVGSATLRVGMIGLVYTDPRFRGRGLAAACVRSCVERLRQHGVGLVVLWSELDAFYQRLGFVPAGRERMLVVDAELCGNASKGTALRVRGLQSPELARVERLLHTRPSRVARAPGSLLRLASAPETRIAVAWRDAEPVAYAALGRGDDFQGVVHEWAGETDGVIACVASFCRPGAAVGLLAGPDEHPASRALERAGASVHEGPLGWVRMLDAGLVARVALRGADELRGLRFEQEGDLVEASAAHGTVRLAPADATALLLDGRIAPALAERLSVEQTRALQARLPWPLYLWGFDSI